MGRQRVHYPEAIEMLTKGMTRKQTAKAIGINYDRLVRYLRYYEAQTGVSFPYDIAVNHRFRQAPQQPKKVFDPNLPLPRGAHE